ncbi:hypothetical protein WJX75_007034 [Coccomyxa subellipsoidea]|uniref:Uncharacterized protein n=1 Tax=Coccomyxa subellipsoidea TaxID=248742 RepID=A0ABR2YKR4_9CHLO
MMGGIGTRVRRRVRSSGMKGVDAGLMCGFGVGYGFGAGLVLKPSALQAVQRGVQELSGRLAVAAQSGLPTQLNHLVKHPALESLPSVRQQGPGMGAQAVTYPALRLGDFSVGDEGAVSMPTLHRSHPSGRRHQVKQDGRSASDHLRLRDSSGSATGEPRVLEERPGQQLHVKVEQPDLQDFTAALRELTAGLNDCTSSLKEATLELKQACADLRQSSKALLPQRPPAGVVM